MIEILARLNGLIDQMEEDWGVMAITVARHRNHHVDQAEMQAVLDRLWATNNLAEAIRELIALQGQAEQIVTGAEEAQT